MTPEVVQQLGSCCMGEVGEARRSRKLGRAKFADNISKPTNITLGQHLILDAENGWLLIFIAFLKNV